MFKSSTLSKAKTRNLLVLASPAILFLIIFNYLPMVGILVAFQNYKAKDGFFGSEWVGFKNFEFLFKSQDAMRITINTISYNLIFIFLGLSIGVIFALLLYEVKSKSALKLYQTLFFIPFFLSWVVVSYVLFAFISPRLGILNSIIKKFGGESINWYTQPDLWRIILPFMYIWKSLGYQSIIFYTALLGIDKSLFEGAQIDGANGFQKVFYISLPMISNIVILIFIIQLGKIFYADFGMFFYLPRDIGILYSSTDVISTYVFRALRVTGNIGLSAAANFYQSIVGFILVVTTNMIVKKINPERALF
jgi:putative aldouronate transport system permease protein